ncbi:MAG: hypothetical protein CISAcid_11490 [uncultured Acidilobus sp. CIS]|jgi:hypothetical protein|nr:MAG: hypothetical protein CISAcid_11490 [uncultured Acidilobus sp. CIS]
MSCLRWASDLLETGQYLSSSTDSTKRAGYGGR